MPSRSSRSSRLYCVLVSSSSACHQLFFFFFSPSRVSSSMAADTDPSNNTISAASSWDDDGGGGGGSGNGAAAPPISADALIGLAAVAMVLVTLLTAARMHKRWVSRRQRGWDDWAMVVSWLATIPLCGLQIVMARHGAGRAPSEVAALSAGDLAALSRAYVCAQAAARVAGCAAKSSVLLLHLRAFYPRAVARPRDGPWRAMLAALALNAAYTVAFAAALAALRDRAPWTPLLAAASAANLACDAVALAVPVAAVRRLHIPPVSRTYVVAVLGAVGAVAPVAGLARLACQLVVAAENGGGGNGNGNDDAAAAAVATYTVFAALATVDQIVAVFVGCAPMIIPVWAHAPAPAPSTQHSAELVLGGKQQQLRRRARDPYSSIMGDNDDEEMWWPSSSLSSSSSSRDVAVVDEAVSPEPGTGWEECEYVFKPLEPVFLSYDNGREHKLFVLFLPPLPLDSFEAKGCA
ncbi:hypothetical protein F4809DRAFT_662449 [Biscogniauxia mediterranea]|nr:hypothetical protein F4809DRAFT_662449 [Biscogniauxia mediterranea]